MTTGTTDPTAPAPDSNASGTAVVTPTQSQPQQPQSSPGVDPADGKLWKDKFYGTQGRLQQVEAQHAQQMGALQAQAEGLQGTLRERDAAIASLQQQVQQATEQLGAIPGMQSQITELQQRATLADRYRAAMQHPELLGAKVEIERPGADGQMVKEQVNPLLSLIENTTLTGDALVATLQQMAAALPKTPQTAPVMQGAVPPPPAPVQDELAALRQKAVEIQDRLNGGDATVMQEHADIWMKIRETEAAARG